MLAVAADDEQPNSHQNLEISNDNSNATIKDSKDKQLKKVEEEEEELRRLLLPNVDELPHPPPSAVEANFTTFFAPENENLYETFTSVTRFLPREPVLISHRSLQLQRINGVPHDFSVFILSVHFHFFPNFMKPGHDQYVRRHANGLCVIGLTPNHVALKDKGGIVSVDFNVGKSDRSGIKVTGKNKKNAQHFEANTALCKVCTGDGSYIVRCCVKGSMLEVNDRLIKQPELLNAMAEREGYVAIMMPRPADWLKAKASLLDFEGYRKLRTEH